VKKLEVFGDSELVVLQVKYVYSTKDNRLKLYKEVVMKMIDKFEAFSIKYIPRSQNDLADTLVVHASSSQTLEEINIWDIIKYIM
jgi:ribonuclease HI